MSKEYEIEKILKRKTDDKGLQWAYVKWKNFGKRHNKWLLENDIVDKPGKLD